MKARGLNFILLIVLLDLPIPCFSGGQASHAFIPDDDWKVSTPEKQGVDSRKLLEMFQDIKAKGGGGRFELFSRRRV